MEADYVAYKYHKEVNCIRLAVSFGKDQQCRITDYNVKHSKKQRKLKLCDSSVDPLLSEPLESLEASSSKEGLSTEKMRWVSMSRQRVETSSAPAMLSGCSQVFALS